MIINPSNTQVKEGVVGFPDQTSIQSETLFELLYFMK